MLVRGVGGHQVVFGNNNEQKRLRACARRFPKHPIDVRDAFPILHAEKVTTAKNEVDEHSLTS